MKSKSKTESKSSKDEILSSQNKPKVLSINTKSIPALQKKYDRWLGWNWVWHKRANGGKGTWTKRPVNVHSGRSGSSTDPETWCTFKEALAAQQAGEVDGIGFALGEAEERTHFAGLDLDNCRDPKTGKLSDRAREIIAEMNTYAEVSPSGTGVKLFFKGILPAGCRNKSSDGSIEAYDHGRYFCVTGQHVEGTPNRIEERQEQLAAVCGNYLAKRKTKSPSANGNGHIPNEAVLATIGIKPELKESDGSQRLILVAREAVRYDLDDATAIRMTRAYEQMYPFPRSYSDEEIIVRLRDAEKRTKRGSAKSESSQVVDVQQLLDETPELIRRAARKMLESPDLLDRVVADVSALGVAGEIELVKSVYLIGTSRLLTKPLSAIIQAKTSSGKSHVAETVARLFPSEAVIHASQITPQALFYMAPGSLSHRFVVAGERSRMKDDGAAEATRALREMISTGRITKLVTELVEGVHTAREIEQDGPIAYIETTSMTKIFEEDANRCLLLSTDSTKRQTKAVLSRLADRFSGVAADDIEAIIARHHAAQRMLEPIDVVVPFAQKMAELFDSDQVVARRCFPQLMSMIQVCALIHQFQRDRNANDRLVAEAADYAIARELCRGPIARSLGKTLGPKVLDFLDSLKAFGTRQFTTTQAERKTNAKRTAQDWLGKLMAAGAIKLVRKGSGPKPSVWRLTDPDLDRAEVAVGAFKLPTVAEVCP